MIEFIISMSGRFGPDSMRTVRTGLRSFLRYLHIEGLCDQRLSAAVAFLKAL